MHTLRLLLVLPLASWMASASPMSLQNLTSSPLSNISTFDSARLDTYLTRREFPKELDVILRTSSRPLSPTRAFMTAITMLGLLALGDFISPMPQATTHYRENMDDDLTITVSSLISHLGPEEIIARGFIMWATLLIFYKLLQGGQQFSFCDAQVTWLGAPLGTISFTESSNVLGGQLSTSTHSTIPGSSRNQSLASTAVGDTILDWDITFNSAISLTSVDVFMGTLGGLIMAAQEPPDPMDHFYARLAGYDYLAYFQSKVHPAVLDKPKMIKTLVATAVYARNREDFSAQQATLTYGGRLIALGAITPDLPPGGGAADLLESSYYLDSAKR